MFPIEIAERALAEAEAAAERYEAHRPGQGTRFRHELDHVLTNIRERPELYQSLTREFRRAFLRRFPHVVVYRVLHDRIQIIGVAPTKADPTGLARLVAAAG